MNSSSSNEVICADQQRSDTSDTTALNADQKEEAKKEHDAEKKIRVKAAKKKILREAMRDVAISTALVAITMFVTHGGLNSPLVQPSSIIAQVEAATPSVEPTKPMPDLKTRPSRPPVPLFGGDHSYVDDYYTGDIYSAFEEADNHENAFIMFYSPWDADCLRAVQVFEAVAKKFVDMDLYVAAVNCWEPNGDCHREFGGNTKSARGRKLAPSMSMPVLVFYPKNRKGIQYHGPISEQSMIEFLLIARQPYKHLATKEQFYDLKAQHWGNLLVGYFPGLPTNEGKSPRAFKLFLTSVYQLLEDIDPFQRAIGGVGIVTSQQLAINLQLDITRPVRYFHWNGTSVSYPNKTISSSMSFLNWIKEQNGNDLVSWVGTGGRKSLTLSARLLFGSSNSLIVFLPRQNKRFLHSAMYKVMETALQYQSCDDNVYEAQRLIQKVRNRRRLSALKQDAQLYECLSDPWFLRNYPDIIAGLGGQNTTMTKPLRLFNNDLLFRRPHRPKHGSPSLDSQVSKMKISHRRLECSLLASTLAMSETLCDSNNILYNLNPSLILSDETESDLAELAEVHNSLEGLGCSDNKTLNIYVADSVTQWSLMSKLGLPTASKGGVQALITVPNSERNYILQSKGGKSLSQRSLDQFIVDFHENPDSLAPLQANKPLLQQQSNELNSVSVEEINAKSFAETLLQAPRTRPVVVLYTSSICAFCSVANHVFLIVKRLISPDLVKFTTIDASQNDLPWAFTALSVPSVLFFHPTNLNSAGPPFNSSETRAFPSGKRLSVPNLLNFIVANLNPEARLRLALSLCDDDCLKEVQVALFNKKMAAMDSTESGSGSRDRSQEMDLLLSMVEKRVSEMEAKPGHNVPGELHQQNSLHQEL